MHFSAGQDVRLKNYGARTAFHQPSSSMGIDNFISIQLHKSYAVESSRLGELKYAISAGYDIRLKNKSFQKAKIDIAYMVTVL